MRLKNNSFRFFLLIHICFFGIYDNEIIGFITNENNLSWYLQQTDVEGAWEITKGSPNITVAIIDTGIDFNHFDLNHSAWINSNEIPNNSIDDDANGYIDDINGWDWVNNDNNVEYSLNDKIHYHGTFISGIIAGKDDNSGIVGIAPNIHLMGLRVVDKDLLIPKPSSLADAVEYAINEKADIISMSLDLFISPPGFHSSIMKAMDANIPLIASTGNTWVSEGGGIDTITIPAVFSEVIAVGATNYYQEKADYSNFGDEIELVAPVGDEYHEKIDQIIESTSTLNKYTHSYGTSFAAPQVAAVIALIKSIRNDLTINDIRIILHTSANDIGPKGWDRFTGYGLLNASAAIRMAQNYERLTNQTHSNTSPWAFLTAFPKMVFLFSMIVFTIFIMINKKQKT